MSGPIQDFSPPTSPLSPGVNADGDLEGAVPTTDAEVDTTNAKSRTVYRWPVLVLVSLVMFGSYYCYDNPAALNTYFTENTNSTPSNMPKLTSTEFNGLYTAYSVPNTVLPFLGGFLVDKLGCRVMLVMFTVFLVCGQALFAFGASLNSYAVMMAGRVVYGFGGESLCVAAQTLLADWFMGREMAMAMGINLSVSRIGSVVNDQTSVILYKSMGLPGTLWVGVIIVGCACGAAILTALLDKRVEDSTQEEELRASRCSYAQAIHRSFSATKSFGQSFTGSFTGSFSAQQPLKRSLLDEAEPESEEVHLSDIKNFRGSFWLICVGCVVVYGCVLPFNNIASDFLSHKYYPGLIDVPKSVGNEKDEAVSAANTWMMIPFIISAVLSPFLGGVVDRVGQRANLMLASALALVAVHMFFALAPATPCNDAHAEHRGYCYDKDASGGLSIDIDWYAQPVIGLVLQGVAYSVYAAAIWPGIVYVVKPNQVGTAYGLVTAVQNTGLAFVPLAVGALTEDTPASNPSQHAGGYRNAEFFFVACAIAGCVISVILINTKDGKRINKQNPDEA